MNTNVCVTERRVGYELRTKSSMFVLKSSLFFIFPSTRDLFIYSQSLSSFPLHVTGQLIDSLGLFFLRHSKNNRLTDLFSNYRLTKDDTCLLFTQCSLSAKFACGVL